MWSRCLCSVGRQAPTPICTCVKLPSCVNSSLCSHCSPSKSDGVNNTAHLPALHTRGTDPLTVFTCIVIPLRALVVASIAYVRRYFVQFVTVLSIPFALCRVRVVSGLFLISVSWRETLLNCYSFSLRTTCWLRTGGAQHVDSSVGETCRNLLFVATGYMYASTIVVVRGAVATTEACLPARGLNAVICLSLRSVS